MRNPTSLAMEADLLARLRRVLAKVEAETGPPGRFEGALARFTSLERRRMRRKALADAREYKDLIIARLVFLAELDEVTDSERDLTVFEEIALQFEEIGAAATGAAVSIRSLLSVPDGPIPDRH